MRALVSVCSSELSLKALMKFSGTIFLRVLAINFWIVEA
jgi:hypothetical protein